jgi:hypothetical protein
MDRLFYELIRMSIGVCSDLSSIPSNQEWLSLRSMAMKQAIDGIAFEGFIRFKDKVGDVQKYQELKFQWMASVLQLEQRNELTNLRAQQLTNFFKNGGFRTCVLKGQGVALLYPNFKRRRCGDIDLWVEGERDEIVNFIRSKGVRIYDVHLVHATAEFFKDVPVEIHFCPSWMYNPFLNKKLKTFFDSQASEQFAHYDETVGFAYPTVFFNLVHSMVHINRHVFEEGIGLRQLMDYYFILKNSSCDERKEAYKVLCSIGLKKFVGAVMYVMQQVFLLEEDLMLCVPNTMLGSRLLDSVMAGGNFGKALGLKHGRNKLEKGWLQWKHNLQQMLPYTNEAMWIPFFQVWHYGWRKKHGYL